MSKNTSITLNDHFQDFINKEISSGRYNNTSEVIRTALRLLQQHEEKLESLRIALKKGEESGFIEDFNAEANLKDLHKNHL
ncbi:MAG: type II toxin-antitoxin system ParD family antitoxin [Gracilimonas sp.]